MTARPDALTALPHPTDGRAPLRCTTCGRVEPRSAGTLGRLARGTWPECCGRVMRPAAEPEPELGEPVERRAGLRRPAKPGSRAEVRRGSLGMGPDLAVGLVDVSEGGAQVRLSCPLIPGEQIQIALWPPRGVRSVRLPATVCWCRTDPGGAVRAGVRLRERLSPRDVSKLGL
jgi:hypothetical protein